MHEMRRGFVQEQTGDPVVMKTGPRDDMHHVMEFGVRMIEEQAIDPSVDEFVSFGLGWKFDDQIHKRRLVQRAKTFQNAVIVFVKKAVLQPRLPIFRV